jgi:hypothetical protein
VAWSTPVLFTVGEIPTASKLNIIQNNLRHLRGLDGAIEVEDAISKANGPELLMGSSRQKFWSVSGLAGVAQTVIPDGAGDVTVAVAIGYNVYNETGAAWVGSAGTGRLVIGSPGSITLYTDGGGNTVTATLNANGSVTAQRTAGTNTYSVFLTVQWR